MFCFPFNTEKERNQKDKEGIVIDGANDAKNLTMGGSQQSKQHEKERKIGHRRVGDGGEITYKKIQSSQIMGSIQLGIQHTACGNFGYIKHCCVLICVFIYYF